MDERTPERRYPLPEVIQPDPMLQRRRGTFGTIAVSLAAIAVVALVLYGLTRPDGPQQEMANAPSQATQTAPAGGPAPQPSTTGQGQSGDQTKSDQAKGDQAKPEQSQGKPARSDSANDTGSKNQGQPQKQ